jgi:DNA-binding PadR family transcriptional regulator
MTSSGELKNKSLPKQNFHLGFRIMPIPKNLMYIHSMKGNNQLFKGTLTTIILKLLREEGKMYGYEITKKVKEQSNGSLSLTEGALYPALHKLEADGLVEVTIEQVGNRPRKYYHLTANGKKEVSNKLEELHTFIAQMQSLLDIKPNVFPG